MYYALQSLFISVSNLHLHFQCDNMSAVCYINNMGGMTSVEIDNLAGNIWQWCIDREIFISASHLSGSDNISADFLSRNFSEFDRVAIKKGNF